MNGKEKRKSKNQEGVKESHGTKLDHFKSNQSKASTIEDAKPI